MEQPNEQVDGKYLRVTVETSHDLYCTSMLVKEA